MNSGASNCEPTQPPPERARDAAEVLAEDDPGVASRRPRCRCPASPPSPSAGSGPAGRAERFMPVIRRAKTRVEPSGDALAPGRDRVALGGHGDARAQRAGAGLARGVDVQRRGDPCPRRVLQPRGDDVAALLPDRVRGAVDAEVDVERPRAGPAERDRRREAAGRVARRRRGGVDGAAGDPGDREPVAVAGRDLDLGDRPPSSESTRSGGARRRRRCREMNACGTPPSLRRYATAPPPSRARSTLPTETTSAFGPSSGAAGNQPAWADAAGTRARAAISRTIRRRGKAAPGRGAPTGSNRRGAPKVPAHTRAGCPRATSLLAERRHLARAACRIPAELLAQHVRDALDRARVRGQQRRAAVSPSRVRRSSTSPTVRACSRRAA